MTYSRVMDLAVGKMDASIAEWCRRHPDYVYDKPGIIHEKEEDGVYYGQVWLAEEFFIYVFGESWDENISRASCAGQRSLASRWVCDG